MSADTNRRDFLKRSSFGIAAGAATQSFPAWNTFSAPQADTAAIKVLVTDEKRRFERGPDLHWGRLSASTTANVIVLDPGIKYQQVLGFGAAFTDASCYMFDQLPEDARAHLIHELFDPSELGLNVCRTCIGASDYSTELYSFDEGEPDLELKRFSIEHDRKYILPTLRQARAVNPDLFLFSSPWSPPGWMKANGSMLGGCIRKRYFPVYARYFVKFLQAYRAEGVPIQALTSQNEVDTDQDGRMPACLWGQEYEIEFVKSHLGPALKSEKIPTKIWLIDHNYNLWGRAICELDDPQVSEYSRAVAWHGYAGDVSMVSKVHEVHPDAQMYWTEGGPDISSPDYETDWTRWGGTFIGVFRNWCQSVTGWNLALDEKGRPNIGPFPCGGLVTIHSQTKKIRRSGQYWGFAHFSRSVRRGAHRFDSSGTLPGVAHVAFENPSGERILILCNTSAQRTAVLQTGASVTEVHLPENSLTTLIWN